RAHLARVFKKGKMVFENGLRSIPCTVRNLAEGGALLEFEQPYLLPAEFELYMELADYEVTCERRWEEGLRCGVEFVGDKRHKGKQREQVLQPSDVNLGTQNFRSETAESILDSKRGEPARQPKDPASATVPPAGTGKRTFGKRK
ncbi:PilZ domain-containing protein, partial [Roseibium sp.]|uniref:PilZ domain-containing protein n=1 Tax=Roseibium sp. TaxID=1936156 RepID=UPI003D126893